jgi:hypothetical protein
MKTILYFLSGWFLISIPVGMIVGRLLRFRREQVPTPAPDRSPAPQPTPTSHAPQPQPD